MGRILLIEDSPVNQKLVAACLSGHEVLLAGSLGDARLRLSVDAPELILLDVQLPDGDGFSFFVEIQADVSARGIPVLFLTARAEVADRVTGYSLGADDYITKPIEPVEFRARVETRLRKCRQSAQMFVRDGLSFNLNQQSVTLDVGKGPLALDLTALEFKLLLHLARHKDQVFSREALIQSIWSDGLNVNDRTVDSHLSHLRKHLRGSALIIQSVYGAGYKLTSTVPAKAKAA